MEHSPSATRQPKQARARRTRERILDQAERAFAAKGFEAASLTSDILDPAGISVGSFYHQFSDKRAVLYALLDERRADRLARATELTVPDQASFDAAVRHGMLELLRDIDEHPEAWWIHFRELHHADPEIRRVIEQSWAMWMDSIRAIFERWVDEPGARSFGRSTFATCGLAGVLRVYLDADGATRLQIREGGLDDAVAACVASFSGCLSAA